MIIADHWTVGLHKNTNPSTETYVQFYAIDGDFAMRELNADSEYTSTEMAFGEFINAVGRVELWLDKCLYTETEAKLIADNLGANCFVSGFTKVENVGKHINYPHYPIWKLIKTA